MPAPKKLTKEELREDRVATALKELVELGERNLKWVVGVAIVAAVAVVAVVLFLQTRARAEETASATMAQAEARYFAGNYAEALTQFETVANNYGSTRSARLAPLFAGNCQLALGNPAEAEKQFRSFLSNPGSGPNRQAAAHRALAASLADQKKPGEAAEEYQRAAQVEGNLLAADDWMAAGNAFGEAGRWAEAAEAYQKVIQDFPQSRRVQEARVLHQEAQARG